MQCLQHRVQPRALRVAGRCACLATRTFRVKCHGVRSANGDRRQEVIQSVSPWQGAETYEQALEYARLEAYEDARSTFEHLLNLQPSFCKAWVSWAQMEKRCYRYNQSERWHRCRAVLQRGLELNPSSSCLIQAWGLMELQRGNWLAAVMMLERSARLDARCVPVLRWHHVRTAKTTVGSRRSAAAIRNSNGGSATSSSGGSGSECCS
ncbi:hypothetical protein VaNZ11_000875 [Volvox africanus]|uniref:Uncharacterized protein n=1 Tax=Volvox africanus TaxID=51714 RepID=A0ABQ5RPS3_9CHLO|nr:hypothetical protein VaNZ11_000875 [Volvox africanus]